ncbi:hypothetical protein BH11BAC3_BH11BAC3_06030 [soil metagenome]
MPKFAMMLYEGMRKRGHNVSVWTPKPFFYKMPVPKKFGKWLGYIDQYLVFPFIIRYRLRKIKANTLFVFSDQALGPWVPLVAKLPHVIHCHDFLAQQSALNNIQENKVTWTGKKYQSYIRNGFCKGRNFISVSNNTQKELEKFLVISPLKSEVVYNGLNQSFAAGDVSEARTFLSNQFNIPVSDGYILHVGGNQWYKNRQGVIEIYDSWCTQFNKETPLVLVGRSPAGKLSEAFNKSPFKKNIYFLSCLSDDGVKIAYKGASVFLFPSLAEGFGWPIAEAMASGCPVITTNEAPMTEVVGNAGFLINRRPSDETAVKSWANESAKVLNEVLELKENERKLAIENGIENAKRFDSETALNKIEAIYSDILNPLNQVS